MILLRDNPETEPENTDQKPSRLRGLIILGIFLDIVLILVFSLWLYFSKSSSEFDMMVEEMKKTEEINRDLFKKIAELQEGVEPEYSGDVVLSVSNSVLNKISQNLFPLRFPLKGGVTGMIHGEQLSDFQFVDQGRILFRIKLVGEKLKYNPRGNSMTDRMLGGTKLQEKIILNGTGEINFTFDEKKQRLDLRYDIAGIDFKTGLPQFLEKAVKDHFSKELRSKPNHVDFNFKPLEVELGDKKTRGNYHIKNVVIQANRLMAIAVMEFENTSEE